jgi:hypothetical protein
MECALQSQRYALHEGSHGQECRYSRLFFHVHLAGSRPHSAPGSRWANDSRSVLLKASNCRGASR